MSDYSKAIYISELCKEMDSLLKRIHDEDADFSTQEYEMDVALATIDEQIAIVSAACQNYVDNIDDEGGPAKAQYNREMEDWNSDER